MSRVQPEQPSAKNITAADRVAAEKIADDSHRSPFVRSVLARAATNGRSLAQIINPRKHYLSTIGLALDPFSSPVAEQELALASFDQTEIEIDNRPSLTHAADQPSFFAYFTPLSIHATSADLSEREPNHYSIIDRLRENRPAFVFGEYGSGKTSLRLTLEATCRRAPRGTLVVSYLPGVTTPFPRVTEETHWYQLSKSMAIDLAIQIIEQFNPLHSAPTQEQIGLLRHVIKIGDRHLERIMRYIMQQPEPDHPLGLGVYWRQVNRSAVRYVRRTPELIQLIEAALDQERYTSAALSAPASDVSGRELLHEMFAAAHVWGFKQIILLVDGVDNRQYINREMFELIEPLINAVIAWQPMQVSLKFFLPSEMERLVSRRLVQIADLLPSPAFTAIIRWNNSALRDLLVARFRAAQSRRVNFEDLAADEFDGQLDELMIQAADGSPRRLIQIVNALINAHVARDPDAWTISIDDWEYMRKGWDDLSTAPPQMLG